VSPGFVTRAACPACGGAALKEIYACGFREPPVRDYLRDFYQPVGGVDFARLEGASYVLCECAACGMVFQRDVPGDELMVELYERWIDPVKSRALHHGDAALGCFAEHAREIATIVAFLGGRPQRLRVLDFAAGWGEWARMARAFGCDTSISELSASRVASAREQGLRTIPPAELPGHAFDLINTEQVLEHLPQPHETLLALRRSLAPGGLLKVCVPNGRTLARRLRAMDWTAPKGSRLSLNLVSPLEHINCFMPSSLRALAARAGYRRVTIPLRTQWRHCLDLSSARALARSFLRAPYRNSAISTYVFLKADGQPTT
jgi:SAM-dependent methyltransferase